MCLDDQNNTFDSLLYVCFVTFSLLYIYIYIIFHMLLKALLGAEIFFSDSKGIKTSKNKKKHKKRKDLQKCAPSNEAFEMHKKVRPPWSYPLSFKVMGFSNS